MNLAEYRERLDEVEPLPVRGKVRKAVGLLIEGAGVWAPVGAKAIIQSTDAEHAIHAEVVGFQDDRLFLMPLEGIMGVRPGSLIQVEAGENTVRTGADFLGRVIDGLGSPSYGMLSRGRRTGCHLAERDDYFL